MTLEVNILFSLLNRENYSNYRNYLKDKEFTKESFKILKVIDKHFQESTEDLTLDDLVNKFFAEHKPDEYYKAVFENLRNKQPSESFKSLLEAFKTRGIALDLSAQLYEVSEGLKPVTDVFQSIEELKNPVDETKYDFVTDDLNDILDECLVKPGLKFRLKFLQQSLGSLRKGDFGFVVARPEIGKTAFLCSEVSHMATQLTEEDGPVLWFNMEDGGKKVKARIVQATLGMTIQEINRDRQGALEKYNELTKGKILLHDNVSPNKYFVESMFERYKPSLAVFDQLDKVGGFSADREDLRLGSIYLWARGLAKRYCPIIGISQSDGSGEGQEFLTMANISNSKTSKAAEADWIVGIGAKNEWGSEHIRGISILKNKLIQDPQGGETDRHGKRTVLIRPQIQRYMDAS
jgi:replicative DNA helicase